jgi:3-keto-5-aminohexanoate cleavage enzyme
MDKKLVINVAPTGAFIKREQNTNQAYIAKEVAKEAAESYKVGASVFHVHVRDERGIIQPKNITDIKEAADRVLDECPEMILSHSGHVDFTKRGAASIRSLVDPLIEAGIKYGRRYIHTVVIRPDFRPRTGEAELREIIEYLQGNGVRAEFQIANYQCLDSAVRWVIEPGVLKKPYIMNLLSGIHGPGYVGPTVPDPWSQLYLLSMLMSMKQRLPDECVFGATVGGRNWLPLTVGAIMLGVDCVRIGMEDTIWMYPHKDEKIRSCAQVVSKVATIATELGRDIATPSQAKEILGLAHG